MTSPTARSLAYLRKKGYIAEVVERFNYFTKQRKDLFNVIDLIAVRGESSGVLGVQSTSRGDTQKRVRKCEAEPMIRVWLKAGNKLEVHGWGIMGKKGKRKKYEIKVVEIT